MSRFFVAALLTLFMIPSLSATTRTWTGTTGNNWTTAANWGGTAPVAGDDLLFPASGANQSTTNDFPAGTTFNAILFTGGNYILSGNGLVLGAGGIGTSGGSHLVNLPITLGAPQTWVLSIGSATTSFSDAINLNGMALTIMNNGSAANILSGVISGAGSITVNYASGINLQAVNTTTAPLTLNFSSLFLQGSYPGPVTLNANAFGSLYSGATVGSVTANGPFAQFEPGQGFPTLGASNSGSIQLTPTSSYLVTLTGVTNFTSLNVTGTVSLGGTALNLSTPGTVFAPGTAFTVINNDGTDAVIGTFAGLSEGATLTSSPSGGTAQVFTITYAGGSGNDVTLTAHGAATTTTTTLTSSSNPSGAGQPVTFTATVAPDSGTATPTGSVIFNDGATTLATVALNASGVATFTTSSLTLGTHTIIAFYPGNGPFTLSGDEREQSVEPVSPITVPTLDARILMLLAIAIAAIGALFVPKR